MLVNYGCTGKAHSYRETRGVERAVVVDALVDYTERREGWIGEEESGVDKTCPINLFTPCVFRTITGVVLVDHGLRGA